MTWLVHSAVLLTSALAADACDEVSAKRFEWKYRSGERLAYSTDVATTITLDLAGAKLSTKGSQSIQLTSEVRKVAADGTAQSARTIERMTMRIEGPAAARGLNYDSAAPHPPHALDVLVGIEVLSRINAQGEVLTSDGPRKLADAMRQAPRMAEMLHEMLTGDGLRPLTGETDLVFPDSSLAPGDTWKIKRRASDPLLGPQTVDMTYEYIGMVARGGRDLDEFEFFLDVTPDSPAQRAPGRKVRDQQYKGTAYFDSAAGYLVESTATRTMQAETTVAGQNVLQHIQTVITTSVTPVSASSESGDKPSRAKRRRAGARAKP